MAGAGSAAQIATIRRSNVGLSWEVAHAFQAYLHFVGSRGLTRSNLRLPSILGLLLRLLITCRQLVHLNLLLVGANMIRFGLHLHEVVRDWSFVCLHVCTLRRIHYFVIHENAARFERGLILIGMVRVCIRSVHRRGLVLVQVYALRWRRQHWQARVGKLLIKSYFVAFYARVLRRQTWIVHEWLLRIRVLTLIGRWCRNLTCTILAHLSRGLHWLLIKIPVPRSTQICLLIRLVHEAAAVRLVVEVVAFFQVIVRKLHIILILTSLLRAEDQRIIALSQIGVLVGHLWWRFFIHVVVAHAVGVDLAVLVRIVDWHWFSRLIVEICGCMWPLVEREWLRLPGHGRLRVASSCAILRHRIAISESIQIDVNGLHAQQLAADVRALACRVTRLGLLRTRNWILLIKRSGRLGTITNQLLNILLLFTHWVPMLRLTTVWIADHHVWRIELIDLLITCGNIAVVLDRTLTVRSRINVLDLLWTAQWCLNLGHIQLQLFSLHGRFGWVVVVMIRFRRMFRIDAHSGSFLLVSCLADPRNIGDRAWTLALFSRYLQAHETRNSVLAQVNGCVIRILIIFLLWTIFMLESVDVLADHWKITLITNICARYFGNARYAGYTSRAISIFIITAIP